MRLSSRSDRSAAGSRIRSACLALAVLLSPALSHVSPARSDPSSPGAPRDAGFWLLAGILTGSAKPDDHLADYQWDTSARLAYGGRLLAGRGRFAAGVGVWQSSTRQSTGFAGAGTDPVVTSTSWELTGEGRLVTVAGLDLLANVAGGRRHLAYEPDHMAIDPGTGTPVEVSFDAVNTWTGGGGIGARHRLGANLALGVSFDGRWYALDTAHRNGSVIEEQRETFGEWSARFEMAWIHAAR